MASAKLPSDGQLSIIRKPEFLAVLSTLKVDQSKVESSAWMASGAIGRVLPASQKDIGALEILKARPYYLRSAREAEWQSKVLQSLREYRTKGDIDVLVKTITDLFEAKDRVTA